MRFREKWHLYLLALLAVVVAVLAVLEIGPPSSSARTTREVVTAEDGVVQSTVSGTGNVQAGTDEDVNFKTSGTLEAVYVSTGQHVKAGQLLAQLNPASAQLALDQAEESLTSAEDQLTATENGTASGSGAGSGSSAGGSSTGASYTGAQGSTEFVSDTTTTERTTTRPSVPTSRPSRPTTTSRSSTPTTTSRSSTGRASAPSRSSTLSSTKSTGNSSSKSTTTPTTTTTTPSPSAIASAQAAVYGAQANVDNAKQTLAETKLYAPVSGTIASMANLVPGDAVSAGSTSTVSSSSSSSSSTSGTGSSGAGGGTSAAGSLGGSSGSSSTSSSGGSGSSSPFAEIVNTSRMSMTVAFSESDISKIKVGQSATITMDALAGVELPAHVSQISDVGTTSSSVVSYDATLTVDQTDPRVKPGMSASASVIVGQAQGVSVPNAAVTGSGSLASVNLDQGGKTVQHQVVVGLRGDSRTQIVSGLSAGQQLVVTQTLPSLSTSATGTTSGGLGGRGLGGGGLGGGGLGGGGGFFRGGGLGGGGGAFFRGGG